MNCPLDYITLFKDLLIIVATFLAIHTFVIKHNELIGSKLREFQLQYLISLRENLSQLSIDVRKVYNNIASYTAFDDGGYISGFAKYDPDGYLLFLKTQSAIKDIYYKGQDSTSYIFPKNFEHIHIQNLSEYLKQNKLEHFSMYALSEKQISDMEELSVPILQLRNYIDDYLKKHL